MIIIYLPKSHTHFSLVLLNNVSEIPGYEKLSVMKVQFALNGGMDYPE
jgi:hypothetical protein